MRARGIEEYACAAGHRRESQYTRWLQPAGTWDPAPPGGVSTLRCACVHGGHTFGAAACCLGASKTFCSKADGSFNRRRRFWVLTGPLFLSKEPRSTEVCPGGGRSQRSLLPAGLDACFRALRPEHEAPSARSPPWQQVPAAPANSLINWDLSSRTGRSLFWFVFFHTPDYAQWRKWSHRWVVPMNCVSHLS